MAVVVGRGRAAGADPRGRRVHDVGGRPVRLAGLDRCAGLARTAPPCGSPILTSRCRSPSRPTTGCRTSWSLFSRRRLCPWWVALPQDRATDDHRTIVARHTDAKRETGCGQLEAEHRRLPPGMRAAPQDASGHGQSRPQQRELPEREAVILARLGEFTQALFDHDSTASHPDERLRDTRGTGERGARARDGGEPGSTGLRPYMTTAPNGPPPALWL